MIETIRALLCDENIELEEGAFQRAVQFLQHTSAPPLIYFSKDRFHKRYFIGIDKEGKVLACNSDNDELYHMRINEVFKGEKDYDDE